MKLHLTYRRIPELSGLTPLRRKLVYQCALEACFAERPERVWSGAPWQLGGALGGALAGWAGMAGSGLSESASLLVKMSVIAGCGLGGLVVGNCIGAHRLHTQLRPYFRRVLEERKDEIAQIN
jgi:hypothetical protein